MTSTLQRTPGRPAFLDRPLKRMLVDGQWVEEYLNVKAVWIKTD
jgi:hypothetical protein